MDQFLKNIDLENPEDITTYKLNHLGLIAGLMKKDGLIEQIDSMIPKAGPHVKLSVGQSVAIMILRLLSTEIPNGLCNVASWAKEIPINLLSLGTHIEGGYNSITRYTLADTLERICGYNANEFLAVIIANNTDIKKVLGIHLDSTSYHFHGVSKEPGLVELSKGTGKDNSTFSDEPVGVKHGHSRDHHPNEPQINFCGASCRIPGQARPILIYGSTFSGNENDVSKFQKFCKQDLALLRKRYPDLEYLVMDSAGANVKALKAAKDIGVKVFTRLSDSKVKADIAELCLNQESLNTISVPCKKQQSTNGHVDIKYKFLGIHKLKNSDRESITILKCGYSAESLRPSKVRSVNKKAQQELEKVQSLLNKLETTPKACEKDALSEFEKITKGVKYCSISRPQLEPVLGYKGRGRPSKDATKEVVAVKLIAQASINQDLVDAAIEKELFYVIATTDIDTPQDDKGALKIYQTYHEQSDIEGCWRDIKATGTFFDSFFLEKVERMKGLLAIIGLALFYQRRLMNVILQVMDEQKISISAPTQKKSFTTSWKSFMFYMSLSGPAIHINNGVLRITKLRHNNYFIPKLAWYIGQEAMDFYDVETYTKEMDLLLEATGSIDESLQETSNAL